MKPGNHPSHDIRVALSAETADDWPHLLKAACVDAKTAAHDVGYSCSFDLGGGLCDDSCYPRGAAWALGHKFICNHDFSLDEQARYYHPNLQSLPCEAIGLAPYASIFSQRAGEPEPVTTPSTPRVEPEPGSENPVGTLEVPGNGSFQSGIGYIRVGCVRGRRSRLTIDDGIRLPATARGLDRGDTEAVCGDRENGFVLVWNWNLMGDGDTPPPWSLMGRPCSATPSP